MAFTYGSVPLRTYLPEGDIDLTVVSEPDYKQMLPRKIFDVLVDEYRNRKEGFVITDIQYVDAEVKLVKCIVNGIVVDISFNQLGGLCALCFLELLDHSIAKDNLFKRSIILIKSWCYYESRILGATHGLLSTYTLETLVLYIFRTYNASLTSPLMVLYKFLEYYRQFDWDNFCISIQGPVYKPSLPEKVVVNPADFSGCGVDCLEEYIKLFTVPCHESMANTPFVPKVLNIIDPLKENNNLGRSVRHGNFSRIKFAIRFGGDTLGKILQSPKKDIQDGIKVFFKSTLQMHPSKFVLEPRLILDDLLVKSVPGEVQYEDDTDSESLKSDCGTRINWNGGSPERNIPSARNRIDSGNRNGRGSGNGNRNRNRNRIGNRKGNGNGDASKNRNSGPDKGKAVATGGFNESTNLSFADFKGDYKVNVRNLMDSQCFNGYPYPPDYPWVWYQPNSPYGQVWPHVASHTVHGTGTFIPAAGQQCRRAVAYPSAGSGPWNRARGIACDAGLSSGTSHNSPSPQGYGFELGSFSGACSNSPQSPHSPQGYGESSAPRQVQTERQLVFGSIDPSFATSPEARQTFTLRARRHAERDSNRCFQFTDEGEFPPLSV